MSTLPNETSPKYQDLINFTPHVIVNIDDAQRQLILKHEIIIKALKTHQRTVKELHSLFLNEEEIKFTKNLEMNTFLIEKDYTTLANYEGGIPFILDKTYDDCEMFYFNVKPIIDKFSSSDDVVDDFYILGEIIDLIDHDLPAFEKSDRKNHSLTALELAAFKKANFNGETSVVASSAILFLIWKVNSEKEIAERHVELDSASEQ